MAKEKTTVCREKEYIITDSEGTPVCLSSEERREYNEKDHISALYPGQPEIEDTSDETMPAASDFTGPCSPDKVLSDEGTSEILDRNREEENIVEIPVFITAVKYIFKRYRLMMFSYMNQLLRQGRLSRITGFRYMKRDWVRNGRPGQNTGRIRQKSCAGPISLPLPGIQ